MPRRARWQMSCSEAPETWVKRRLAKLLRMKPATARWLRRCAVLMACAQIGALAQVPRIPVDEIRIQHVGPASVSDELVRANIRVKKGDDYAPRAVEDDIRNLYGTGYYFNIRVGTDSTEKGVILTYVIQSKPIVTEVRIVGNKQYGQAKLKKKITSKVGEPMDERKLFSDAEEIRATPAEPNRPRRQERSSRCRQCSQAAPRAMADLRRPSQRTCTTRRRRKARQCDGVAAVYSLP